MTRSEVAAERGEICRSCPEFRPTLHTCKICGCWMEAKIWLMMASCPLKKWEAHRHDNSAGR